MNKRYIAEDLAWSDWKTELAFAKRCGGLRALVWLASRTLDYCEVADE